MTDISREALCDCVLSHNGIGVTGRKCDCGPNLLDRLRERALAAREEGTATALGDALHFEEAFSRIDALQTALIAIRRRTIFGPGLTTSDLLDLTAEVAGDTHD